MNSTLRDVPGLDSAFHKRLNLEKIRRDFSQYLDFKNVAARDVIAYDVSSGQQIQVTIKNEDDITILAIRITLSHKDLVYIPILVSIGIGQIQISSSVYKVDKCSADLLYNDDFELIAIDFNYDKLHDSNKS